MVLSSRTVRLLLFSLTLLTVITSSAAALVIVGAGAVVLSFAVGVFVGAFVAIALSTEKVVLVRAGRAALQLLQQRAPVNASDVLLEIECRRLLDRMGQLLAQANAGDRCLHCQQQSGHDATCPVPPAAALYASGKAKRVPWQEFEKRLFKRVQLGERNGDDVGA